MRPVDRGREPSRGSSGTPIIYKRYKSYFRYLESRIGYYCSYCERRIETMLAIDHIAPKVLHNGLILDWYNFLLACVNCNSTKNAQPTVGISYYFPHEVNTAYAFCYEESLVFANPKLSQSDQIIINATIGLVGLDQGPRITPTDSDSRGDRRQEVWDIAQSRKAALAKCPTDEMRDTIADLARAEGHFSIWRTVFADDSTILSRLLTQANSYGHPLFPGTHPKCFAADGTTIQDLHPI